MIRAQGYAQVFGGFKDQEFDTVQCGHCNQIILVKPGTALTTYLLPQVAGPHKEEMGASCRVCMRAVCLKCHGNGRCTPLERQIEQMEARGRFLKSVGVGLLLLLCAVPAYAQPVNSGGRLTGVGLTVTITAPSSATTYDAGTSSSITVSGTWQSDRTVATCTYSNSLGGSGSATVASGTWSITSVALTVGTNTVTVTCTNDAATAGQDVIAITRSSGSVVNPISASRHADTVWAAAGVEGGIPTTRTRCTTGTGTSVLASTSTAAQINTAITGCDANHYVELGSGTFSLSSGITLHTNSVTLKGQGANSTKLVFTGSVSGCNYSDEGAISMCSGDLLYGNTGNFDHSATWSAGYSVGTTVITLSATTGLSVGSTIFLDQLDDSSDGFPATGDIYACSSNGVLDCSNQGGGGNAARSGRTQVVIHRVTNISGSDVTISPALYLPNWRTGRTPQAWWNDFSNNSWLHDTGVEDLSIDITGAGIGIAAIAMHATYNCWVKGVRSITNENTGGAELFHILMINGFHNTIRSNYFDGPDGPDGNQRYAMSLIVVSQTLIENNIFSRTTSGPVPNGPTIGNVIAYNYVRAATMTSNGSVLHGFTEMNLHEGNNMSGVLGDIIHAPHYFETLFRNLLDRNGSGSGLNVETPGPLRAKSRFWNIVGNVMGDGSATVYEQNSSGAAGLGCSSCIYDLGYEGDDNTFGNPRVSNDVTRVKATLFRWGNYDTETAAVRWCASGHTGFSTTCSSTSEVPSTITNYPNTVPSAETLPSSLYLSATPSWFGSVAYPPIGPDVASGAISGYASHAHKIPARVCWESLSDDGGYTAGTVKVFNAATCYVTP